MKMFLRAMSLALCTLAVSAVHAASPAGMKLYVLNSGSLKLGKGYLQNLAPMEPKIEVPVGMFVVKHPKGNVLFDTGSNDKLITDRSYWGKYADVFEPMMTPDISSNPSLARLA